MATTDRKPVLTFFFLFVLTGCASVAEINGRLQTWDGKPADEFLLIHGTPDSVMELQGYHVYKWDSVAHGSIPMTAQTYCNTVNDYTSCQT